MRVGNRKPVYVVGGITGIGGSSGDGRAGGAGGNTSYSGPNCARKKSEYDRLNTKTGNRSTVPRNGRAIRQPAMQQVTSTAMTISAPIAIPMTI